MEMMVIVVGSSDISVLSLLQGGGGVQLMNTV